MTVSSLSFPMRVFVSIILPSTISITFENTPSWFVFIQIWCLLNCFILDDYHSVIVHDCVECVCVNNNDNNTLFSCINRWCLCCFTRTTTETRMIVWKLGCVCWENVHNISLICPHCDIWIQTFGCCFKSRVWLCVKPHKHVHTHIHLISQHIIITSKHIPFSFILIIPSRH